MFEFLKQPISLKRAPSKASDAPAEAPQPRRGGRLSKPISFGRGSSKASGALASDAPAEAVQPSVVPTEAVLPLVVSAEAVQPSDGPAKAVLPLVVPAEAVQPRRGGRLSKPISFKRAPSKASDAPAEAPQPRGGRLSKPISFGRGPSKASGAPVSNAPAQAAQPFKSAPSDAPAQASPSRRGSRLSQPISFRRPSKASDTPAEAARPRRNVLRPQRTRSLVGLEIEPGQLIAVQSRVNGHVVVERAAGQPIAANLVRDGEVSDVDALSTALEELFEGSGLDRRVRIGIANQRIVMRQIELPPITDPKELSSAVHFQAQNEIPMPIDSVVLDYHPLGIQDTPAGPRMQVLLVAARRDMVERMLLAARQAGLRPEGVDLAAFGMIRALRPSDCAEGEQILYLSIGGLTNLAIASGATCQFTRVITTGVEQIVAEVAAGAGVPLADARRLIVRVGPSDVPAPGALVGDDIAPASDHETLARSALTDGIRRIAAEVRNSLDFHLSSHGNVPVSRAVLTGPALDLPGFDLALGRELGLPLVRGEVALATPDAAGHVPMSRLAVAAGLSVSEGAP